MVPSNASSQLRHLIRDTRTPDDSLDPSHGDDDDGSARSQTTDGTGGDERLGMACHGSTSTMAVGYFTNTDMMSSPRLRCRSSGRPPEQSSAAARSQISPDGSSHPSPGTLIGPTISGLSTVQMMLPPAARCRNDIDATAKTTRLLGTRTYPIKFVFRSRWEKAGRTTYRGGEKHYTNGKTR